MSDHTDDIALSELFAALRERLSQKYPDLDFDTMQGWMTARERAGVEVSLASMSEEEMEAGLARVFARVAEVEADPVLRAEVEHTHRIVSAYIDSIDALEAAIAEYRAACADQSEMLFFRIDAAEDRMLAAARALLAAAEPFEQE